MSIVATNRPLSSYGNESALFALERSYPFLRLRTLTTSAYGRPVQAVSMGFGPRQVLYTAAFHANEWITAIVLLKFIEDMARAYQVGGKVYGINANTILENATLTFVPMVNPDGVDLVTGAIELGTLPYTAAQELSDNYPTIPFPDGWKANLLGVDLNLQYPAAWLQAREIKFSQGYTKPGPRDYVGRAPLNQRESIALAEFTEVLDPALVLAYHTQGKVIYWQFRDYQVPGAKALGEEFARLSGYELADTPYESSFAGYKDWFIQNFRRPGYTIEVGRGQNPLPISQFPEIYQDNLGILVTAATGLPE